MWEGVPSVCVCMGGGAPAIVGGCSPAIVGGCSPVWEEVTNCGSVCPSVWECSAVLEGVPQCEMVCPSVEACYQCWRVIPGMGRCGPVWEASVHRLKIVFVTTSPSTQRTKVVHRQFLRRIMFLRCLITTLLASYSSKCY